MHSAVLSLLHNGRRVCFQQQLHYKRIQKFVDFVLIRDPAGLLCCGALLHQQQQLDEKKRVVLLLCCSCSLADLNNWY